MDFNLTLTGIAVLVTHALEAVTGFGCTVLAFPFITALQGIYEAKVLLSVMAWLIGFYIVSTKFRHINFKHFFVIAGLMGAGVPAGIYLFNHFPSETLKLLLGVFIAVTSLFQLKKEYVNSGQESHLPDKLYYFILFCGGVVHGAFATGGPFVVLYATAKLRDKGQFRATLSLLWITLNTALFITDSTFRPIFHNMGEIMFNGGSMTRDVSNLLWMIPFLATGIVAGEMVHNRVEAGVFRKIVFWVLFATGVFMIAAHFMAA